MEGRKEKQEMSLKDKPPNFCVEGTIFYMKVRVDRGVEKNKNC